MSANQPDPSLLQAYLNGSEPAFGSLVERYLPLVHAAALRQVNDPDASEDITQAVFILLAQKAHSLRTRPVLSGWLLQTASFCAADFRKRAQRRTFHERKVAKMKPELITHEATVAELAPRLDAALAMLSPTDRDAVVLHFLENRTLQEVGQMLGLSKDAANKRVARALEKLRTRLIRQGLMLSVATLGTLLGAEVLSAAPVPTTLAAATTSTAIAAAHGTLTATTALTLAKGVTHMLFLAKAKIAVAITLAIVILTTATGAAIHLALAEVPTPATTTPVALDGLEPPGQPAATATAPATRGYTVASHSAAMLTAEAQFTNLAIEYEMDMPTRSQDAIDNRTYTKGRYLQKLPEGWEFHDLRWFSASAPPDPNWPPPPMADVMSAFDGNVTVQLDRAVSKKSGLMSAAIRKGKVEEYFRLPDPHHLVWGMNQGMAFSSLMGAKEYKFQIEKSDEVIDGLKTVKVKGGREGYDGQIAIWVCPDRSFLPLRLETYDKEGKTMSARMLQDLKKLANGSWYPQKIRGEPSPGQKWAPGVVSITRISTEPLQAEAFTPPIPPRTQVTDQVTGTNYTTTDAPAASQAADKIPEKEALLREYVERANVSKTQPATTHGSK